MAITVEGTLRATSRGRAIEVREREFLRVKAAQGGMTQGFEVELDGGLYAVTGRGERFQRAGVQWRYLYVTEVRPGGVDAAIARVNAEGAIVTGDA